MTCKAFIAGFSAHSLTDDERSFFKAEQPWGYIVFARNLETPDQIKRLTESLRETAGRNEVPVLIDQEGGRVQRLRPPYWEQYPPGAALGALYETDNEIGLRAAWLMSRLHAFDLSKLGINVDCLPVLDVPAPDGHDIIGDRAYGDTPQQVAALGRAAAQGLLDGGVMPVIKHIPGHGRARADSHHELPVVETDRETLEKVDFAPFVSLKDIVMAMTAHVIYSALDETTPATTSPTIINDIIRKQLGFEGLLMSDDVSMKALSGDFSSRSRAIIAAGCDVVLHCDGNMDDMVSVASAAPELQGRALERANSALAGIGKADGADEAACREEFASLMAKLPVA